MINVLALTVPAAVNEWLIAAIVALTPVVVMILKSVGEQFVDKIPSWIKPIVAMLIGALAAYLSGLTVANPLIGALIGLAVIGFREIVVQLGRAAGVFAPKV